MPHVQLDSWFADLPNLGLIPLSPGWWLGHASEKHEFVGQLGWLDTQY